jgi:isocitrate/isopropylmalate dehydrogenase
MLRHLGEDAAADRIFKSVVVNLAIGKHLTADLGETCSTSEYTDELIKEIKSRN